MKIAYTAPKIAMTLISLSLGLVVLAAVIPLPFGLSVEPNSDFVIEPDNAGSLKVKGDFTVSSSLPYDINDACFKMWLGRSGGTTVTMVDGEPFNVPKGGSENVVIDGEVFMPTLIAMGLLGHESGKLSIPATISISGSYLEGLAGVGVEVDIQINISNGDATILNSSATAKGNGDYSDFLFTVQASGITFLEDGTSIEAKFGDTTITLSRSGDTITLAGASTGAEGILDDVRNTETIQVTGQDPIDVTEEQMEEFAAVLSELLGGCA